ncbi:MAG TPA: transketolase C-terminal domain-containing protein [Thermoplasmata archaeon]|nr:transketolase C-terminal domain-containing protein [Thermoplasmata archaeon]
MTLEVLSGNHAQSEAVRLARVNVVAAYPITPQTTIVEGIADFVAQGRLPAQFVRVESEHSAMQVCVSAAALGARTYTATSSQGLLLMHELLHWASGMRAPIVMGVVNRAIAPPWSAGADHADTLAQRDTGWIQLYAETNQEVLDMVLEAYRLAEDVAVRLPAMVCEDAFYLSHTVEPVDVPSAETVDAFLPPRVGRAILVPGVPGRLGSFTGPEDYVKFRQQEAAAMDRVIPTLDGVEQEFLHSFGRTLGGPVVPYLLEDATTVLVTLGTASTTARAVVDELRAQGHKAGLLKIRLLRPFPAAEVRAALASAVRVGVLDRAWTFGFTGAVATEVRAALYTAHRRPPLTSFLAGIGGRDVTPSLVRRIFERLESGEEERPVWMDLEPAPGATVHG